MRRVVWWLFIIGFIISFYGGIVVGDINVLKDKHEYEVVEELSKQYIADSFPGYQQSDVVVWKFNGKRTVNAVVYKETERLDLKFDYVWKNPDVSFGNITYDSFKVYRGKSAIESTSKDAWIKGGGR
jgi:hypothetical protein